MNSPKKLYITPGFLLLHTYTIMVARDSPRKSTRTTNVDVSFVPGMKAICTEDRLGEMRGEEGTKRMVIERVGKWKKGKGEREKGGGRKYWGGRRGDGSLGEKAMLIHDLMQHLCYWHCKLV